jgi:LPS export ABC transporter protein LptC
MKGKIVFIILLFLVSVLTVNKVNELLMKSQIQNIKYDYQLITDFILIGKGEKNYHLKGKSLKEKDNVINIEKFDLTYYKDEKPIYINSEKGIYFRNKKILKLFKNVNIKDEKMKMQTEELNVFTDKDIAKTDKGIVILTNEMKTTGKRAVIDVRKERIRLWKVKTLVNNGVKE